MHLRIDYLKRRCTMAGGSEHPSAARNTVIVALSGEGIVIQRRGGQRTVIKVGEAEAGGAYALHENSAPAEFGGVPLHIHREAEEAFYVLEGEMTVYTENDTLLAPAGAFVLIPRGTIHSVGNRGAGPVRWLTLFSPAAGAGWVEAAAALQSSSTGNVDPDELAAMFRQHGMEVVGPPPAADEIGRRVT
jgi:mannose-6-phosphate isomerase-like protein (cupin superfamily)